MLKRFIRFLKTSPLLIPLLALINLILFLIDRLAVITVHRRQNPQSLLIIRLDVLGDYLMFRGYLRQIKESSRYRGYSVTLLGNIAVKSLAEAFDAELIDQFIWADIYKLSTQPLYRFRLVRQLHSAGFAVAFCPTYSRVLVLDDFMAWATGALERVGCKTDYVNISHWEARLGDRLYTRLIDSEPGIIFEMERDRRTVEDFLGESVDTQPPKLDRQYAKPVTVPQRYIVLSLGAGQEFRIWPTERFAEVARLILTQYTQYQLVLTGAPNEKMYAELFLNYLPNSSAVVDLTGYLTIPELVYVLTQADLLITNETGIVHIAAATQTPTIVISQGKSLVRWHPYPESYLVKYLYPAFIEENRYRLSEIAPVFNPESPYDMNEISVDRVVRLLPSLLHE